MFITNEYRNFRCRCAWGKHPSTSRTRWLRPRRPMILYWRRYGKAGGCRIFKKSLPMIWDQKSFWFQLVGKQPKKFEAQATNQFAPWKLHIEWYDINNNLTVRSSRKRMEDTQDIRGKRSCRNATNNYLTRWYRKVSTNNQPSCNAIHESEVLAQGS